MVMDFVIGATLRPDQFNYHVTCDGLRAIIKLQVGHKKSHRHGLERTNLHQMICLNNKLAFASLYYFHSKKQYALIAVHLPPFF